MAQRAKDRGPMTEYGAEELAETAGVSVALLRSYQSKGLLPQPRHVGRIAVYGDHHLERLRHIVALKERGHSLRSIAEQLDGQGRVRSAPVDERLTLRDVSERSGVPVEMLRSMEASGLLWPRSGADGPVYSDADVRAVGCVLLLVGNGIPFDRFIEAAEPQIEASALVAARAVALFHERAVPRLARGDDTTTVDAALREMAVAIGELVAYVVERQVLAEAETARTINGTALGPR